jgi:hypothetical protein
MDLFFPTQPSPTASNVPAARTRTAEVVDKDFLDIWIVVEYACPQTVLLVAIRNHQLNQPVMISARRVSNPGNNRPLPQNLWGVIERSG